MGEEYEESIEFQELSYDLQSTDKVRQFFRIPLDGSEKYLVSINQASYPLIDIAHDGVSFGITPESDLMEGDILTDCQLLIGDQTIEPVKAEVVHLSPGSDTEWICGINWLDLDKNAVEKIDGIIQNLRKKLFPEKNSLPAPLHTQPQAPLSKSWKKEES